ncbi:tRNA (adenosine(37)-N6)-dimethylallyltransferase MiaA [Changpingibacter yushuensis]|uniref:tRNA (adenosine(37)-N6)-dimethylallyltransferase MiaA n=1 Tax=Changpingibacter yushuensis TaxID=2758440 RepID=UPI0015F5666D|nr:tRNA (adenosine(37)-N6)-dimethylallyltransferase MiaA [Changpingibacter yushuensis]
MIVSIVGPTASGKTALSLELAALLGGPDSVEIISADAMQLYRGMDIGTAKLPLEQRLGIPHHQVDVLDVTDEASVAAYQRSARLDVADIQSRDRIPIVVGGSGLYVSGLLDELDFPGHDSRIRAELEATVTMQGLAPLVAELAQKDPRAYATMDVANPRRVVRALEVIRLTGQPYTPRFPRHTSHFESVLMFAVTREKAVLHDSIERRAQDMMKSGLLEETRGLIDVGLRHAPTASRATGYAQALDVIDGNLTPQEAIESIALATRRLAKKQGTWFRADPRLTWFDLTDGDITRVARDIASRIMEIG